MQFGLDTEDAPSGIHRKVAEMTRFAEVPCLMLGNLTCVDNGWSWLAMVERMTNYGSSIV